MEELLMFTISIAAVLIGFAFCVAYYWYRAYRVEKERNNDLRQTKFDLLSEIDRIYADGKEG